MVQALNIANYQYFFVFKVLVKHAIIVMLLLNH